MFSKRFFIVLILASFSTGSAFAGTVIYKSKNKLDFVKIEKAKKQEKEGGLLHPHEFDPGEIRSILRSIRFNKKILLLKDIENKGLFDEGNVEFLAPYLIEAFKKANAEEVVAVSYYTREGKSVIQNDRLTIFRSFLKEDGLHMKFTKMYAKLLGDRTTMGADRMSQEARSLRVGLEPQPGQNRISWDPEEIVFDLATFAAGGMKAPAPIVSGSEPKKEKGKPKALGERQEPPAGEKSVKERLRELDELKKDELITEKEYQRKRRELIEQL